MNCPGHMLLFGSQLRSYRDLPMRYAEAAPLHRNELAGALHGLTRVRYVTQDDAHIFCTRGADRRPSSTAASTTSATSTACSASSRARSSRPGPTTSSAPTRSGTSPRAAASSRARAARDRSTSSAQGEGAVLRAEDRPPHDGRARALAGRWGRSSSTRRCRPGSGSRTWAPTTASTRRSSSTARSSARSSASSGSSSSTTAGDFPLWLAPVQVRVLPVGESAPRGGTRARRPTATRTASASTSTSATRRSASGSATPSSRRCPFVVVYGDRESEEALAVRERGGEAVDAVARRAAWLVPRSPLRRIRLVGATLGRPGEASLASTHVL